MPKLVCNSGASNVISEVSVSLTHWELLQVSQAIKRGLFEVARGTPVHRARRFQKVKLKKLYKLRKSHE